MRSHVFPVCRPGSKTFTSKNKKEGGQTELRGGTLYSETEDKDTVHAEFVAPNPNAGDFWASLFMADTQEKSEFLADLTVAPQTDTVVETNEVWAFIMSWEYGSDAQAHPLSAEPFVRVWEKVNGKTWFKTYPEPGSVFCFGVKKTADSAWKETYFANRSVYGQKYNEVNPPENIKHPFVDGGYSGEISGLQHKLGEWHTVMFTGTRFVLLGSNNWVS